MFHSFSNSVLKGNEKSLKDKKMNRLCKVYQITERTRNSIANDQRKITPKLSKAVLWFLCMTHRLIVLYNCMTIHFNSFNGCQVTERTRNGIANDQREITPKISKATYDSCE